MQTRLTVDAELHDKSKTIRKREEKITLSRPPDLAKRNARSWQNLEREGEKGAAKANKHEECRIRDNRVIVREEVKPRGCMIVN